MKKYPFDVELAESTESAIIKLREIIRLQCTVSDNKKDIIEGMSEAVINMVIADTYRSALKKAKEIKP